MGFFVALARLTVLGFSIKMTRLMRLDFLVALTRLIRFGFLTWMTQRVLCNKKNHLFGLLPVRGTSSFDKSDISFQILVRFA
jgi:hypothetical protein